MGDGIHLQDFAALYPLQAVQRLAALSKETLGRQFKRVRPTPVSQLFALRGDDPVKLTGGRDAGAYGKLLWRSLIELVDDHCAGSFAILRFFEISAFSVVANFCAGISP